MNAGHGHPRIVEAVAEQAARFLHTDFTVVPYEPYVELAERLCALAPISGPTRAAFFNAGHGGGRERGQARAPAHRAARP